MRSTTLSFIPVREYVAMSHDANDRDTLDAWLEQAQAHSLLTRQEEVELTQRIRARDPFARERLILCNLRLVLKIALAYRRANVPLVDLLQEGIGGLMQAVEHFDEQRGFKFSTYAVHWIRQAISRYIDRTARTIRLPSYIIADMSQQNRAALELEQTLQRAPTTDELAGHLEKTRKQVRTIERLPEEPVPLGAPVGGDDSTTTLSDVVEDANCETHQRLDNWIRREQIDQLLDTLTSRERTIIELRFGLEGDEGQTLRAIAVQLGVTKERVRQIEAQAMKKLRVRAHEGSLLEAAS
jgi:RNA polymerase sigma factor (sigma-70 family)